MKMYYRETTTLNYSECRGSRNGPDMMMFSSHEIGQIKAFFSQYERYNDSDVSVSISPGYYDLTITVYNSSLNKGDSWCSYAINKALSFVRSHVISSCRSSSDRLTITIELNT